MYMLYSSITCDHDDNNNKYNNHDDDNNATFQSI